MSQSLSLTVNCGYARVAIRELTPTKRGRNARQIDSDKRESEFQELFATSTFGISESYYVKEGHMHSPFDRHCNYVITTFSKSWGNVAARLRYLSTFSTTNWKGLKDEVKAEHTLSNCKRCFYDHYDIQRTYPAKPVFELEPSLVIDQKISEKANAKRVLREANSQWTATYGHSLTEVVPKMCPEVRLIPKKTKTELKKERRDVQRKLSNHVSQQMSTNATITTLASGESLAQYHRKRMAMSFEVSPPTPKRQKTHSPLDENCIPNEAALLADLENFPAGQYINWSEMGRKHGITNRNAGQIVKDFAAKRGIDTNTLQKKPSAPRTRRRRSKLPGGEISSPALPSVGSIKEERDKMIANGQIQIGEPCAPFTLTKYKTKETGQVVKRELKIDGRKIPLLDIRSKLLREHEQFMHLNTDMEIQRMTADDITEKLLSYGISCSANLGLQDLRSLLASYQRTRTLAIWHDHASILGTGFILITVGIIFDPAVFVSDGDYQEKAERLVDIQQVVEQPNIHMLALGSSSAEDEASLIPDRVECLLDMNEPLTTSNGIRIHDEMRFFKGDAPSQQFERGTQQGGYYKCGSCGCRSTMMEDLAHALQCKWRPLSDIQALVLSGRYGKTPGVLKPFETLSSAELQEELRSRQLLHTATNKKDLKSVLSEVLLGVQRVPTLLIADPVQSLASINLQNYTVLDCEPLHDFKGHLRNVFTELPHILRGEMKTACNDIIETNFQKDKVTCADVRATAIHLFLQLRNSLGSDDNRVILMQTAVQISEILYLPSSQRTPKRVLQLYNCTWLHHTLCSLLFPQPKTALFGIYLHHLGCHAGPQYELMSLRSVNTESEERLFGQAKRMATQASNRHADNVLFNILVRLQAQKLTDDSPTRSIQKQETHVSKAASHVPAFPGTTISKSLIGKNVQSWQAHLKRISTYLVSGKGHWWHSDESQYTFHDGAHHPDSYPGGPLLRHFRQTSFQDLAQEKESLWRTLIDTEIELPTPVLRLYNSDGSLAEIRNLSDTQSPSTTVQNESLSETCCLVTDTTSKHPPTNLDPITTNQVTYSSPGVPLEVSPPSTIHDTNNPCAPTPSDGSTSKPTSGEPSTYQISAETPSKEPSSLHPVQLFTPSQDDEEERTEVDLSQVFEQPSGDTDCDNALKTTLALAISKAIGRTKLLDEFDEVRSSLKAQKSTRAKMNKDQLEKHDRLLAQLQTRTLAKKRELKEMAQTFSAQFYETHRRIPTASDSETYARSLKDIQHIKWLLTQWNIQF